MKDYAFDLHIHSCLSPCAENGSTPAMMAGMFALSGYEIIALTDHNSCGNCRAFLEACDHYGILGIPGMELNTAEDVHAVCLFETLESAEAFSAYVYERLPDIKNRKDIFGDQLYADAEGNTVKEEERLLITATSIGIYEAAALAEGFGGICYPAHIDRDAYSLLGNLGLWDPAMGFKLAEISMDCPEGFTESRPDTKGLRTVRGTDAHRIEQIPEKPGQFMRLPERSARAVLEWLRG